MPIGAVEADSPAQRAGIQLRDLITRIDGVSTPQPEDVRRSIAKSKPGATVEVEVKRGDRSHTFKVVLGERPRESINRPSEQAPAALPPGDKSVGGIGGEADAACTNAVVHWKAADEIKTLKVYQDHLARFPHCEFAELASARIEALKR